MALEEDVTDDALLRGAVVNVELILLLEPLPLLPARSASRALEVMEGF